MKYLVQKLNTNTWQQYVLFSQFIHRFDVSETNAMLEHIFTSQQFVIDNEDMLFEGSVIVAASEIGIQSFLVRKCVENESDFDEISKLSYYKVLTDITDNLTNYFCGMSTEAEYNLEIQKNLRKIIETKGNAYTLRLLLEVLDEQALDKSSQS